MTKEFIHTLELAQQYNLAVQEVRAFWKEKKPQEDFAKINYTRVTIANKLLQSLQSLFILEFKAQGYDICDSDQKSREAISKYVANPYLLEQVAILLTNRGKL